MQSLAHCFLEQRNTWGVPSPTLKGFRPVNWKHGSDHTRGKPAQFFEGVSEDRPEVKLVHVTQMPFWRALDNHPGNRLSWSLVVMGSAANCAVTPLELLNRNTSRPNSPEYGKWLTGDGDHIKNERHLTHSSNLCKEFNSKMTELQMAHFWVKKRQCGGERRVWTSGCHTTFCFDEKDQLYKVKIRVGFKSVQLFRIRAQHCKNYTKTSTYDNE